MRTLLLMRHAKSSWRDSAMDDHDRPLNGRGRRAAPFMGDVLRVRGLVPELILCSTAVRAVETATEVIKASSFDGALEVRRGLYLAEPSAYLDVMTELEAGLDRVLVIGHNPGISELLQLLTGEVIDMPTASVAHLELDVQALSEVSDRTPGRLVAFYKAPRDDEEFEKAEAGTDGRGIKKKGKSDGKKGDAEKRASPPKVESSKRDDKKDVKKKKDP